MKRVTLDGDVIEATNVMTGGQKARPTGVGFKATDTSEVTKLEQDYNDIQSRLDSIDGEIKALQKKISDLYRKKISGDQEGQKFTEKIATAQSKIEQLNTQIHASEGEIEQLLHSIEEVTAKKTDLETEAEQINQQLADVQQQYESVQDQLNSSEETTLKHQLKAAEDALKKLTKQANAIEVEFSKKTTQLNESVINQRQEYQTQIQEKEDLIARTKTSIEENTRVLADEEDHLKALEDALALKSAALSELLDERKQVASQLSQNKMDLAKFAEDIHPLEMKINTIQLKSSEMETKIGEWRCQMAPDIEVSKELLQDSEADLQLIIEHIEQMKAKLGAVNLKAIDRFKEIDTRFHELEAKNEQIVNEREAILQFIEALEAEKKKVFMNTFNNVNKNFGYIFSRLSPGGEAKLELDNMDDPFAGGVEMMARPGEKKWCLTQAMSGRKIAHDSSLNFRHSNVCTQSLLRVG